MDFDDFITLLLFLFFIVSPFLKRKKAKKTVKQGKAKQSGFSVLGRLTETLKEAAREMQARQEKESGETRENQTFWDGIDDRENGNFYPGDEDGLVLDQVKPVNKKPLHISTTKIPETKKAAPITLKSFGNDDIQTGCLRPGPGQLPARARGLRKAVIWSEILGKPVALRD